MSSFHLDDIEECYDAAGQKYYHNKTTGKTGWSREELCTVSAATGTQNIHTLTDEQGQTYYYDPKTGKTGWHLSEFGHDHEEDDIQEQEDYTTG